MENKKLNKIISVIILFLIFFNFFTSGSNATEDSSIKECEFVSINVSGFFDVKEIDGVWWFINNTGDKFYSIGALSVTPSYFFYGNHTNWIEDTKNNIIKWGINTITGDRKDFPEFPTYHRFRFKQLSGEKQDSGWTHTRIPDVFDFSWQNEVNSTIEAETAQLRDDPYLLGYQTDNEMKWGPDGLLGGVGDTLTLLEVYMAAEKNTSGKKKLVSFFKEKYNDDINLFNRVWEMELSSFSDLFDYSEFGVKKAWRIRANISIIVEEVLLKYWKLGDKLELFQKAKDDIIEFSKLVAETYFKVTSNALKRSDPNHLNLGVRFHILGVPEEILKIAGKYVDVLTINYYRKNNHIYSPILTFLAKCYDTVPLGGVGSNSWMKQYYKISGRPILISEFNFIGNDGSWLIKGGESKLSFNQEGRADDYKCYATKCLNAPYIIGHHWFIYRDVFSANWGLVNLWDDPYEPLVKQMEKINTNSTLIHERASINLNEEETLFNVDQFSYLSNNYLNYDERLETFDLSIQSINEKTDYKNIYLSTNNEFFNQKIIQNLKIKNITISIQDIIDNANEGDTIIVPSGEYKEKIIINKSIDLIGENKENTIVLGWEENTDNNVITIVANNVSISNFSITSEGYLGSSGNTWRASSGIFISSSSNCSIHDNLFYELGGWRGGWNIMALNSDYTNIYNNNIIGTGIEGSSGSGNGLIMDSCDNSIVYNNTIFENNKFGIWISSCCNNNISQNQITKNNFGISLIKANNNTIYGNTFKNNSGKGICIKNSDDNVITRNNLIKEGIANENIQTLSLNKILSSESNYITEFENHNLQCFLEDEGNVKINEKIGDTYQELKITNESNFFKGTILKIINGLFIFQYYDANFFYSNNNNWTYNYWNRPYLLPVIIFGKTDENIIRLHAINKDYYPLQKPYQFK